MPVFRKGNTLISIPKGSSYTFVTSLDGAEYHIIPDLTLGQYYTVTCTEDGKLKTTPAKQPPLKRTMTTKPPLKRTMTSKVHKADEENFEMSRETIIIDKVHAATAHCFEICAMLPGAEFPTDSDALMNMFKNVPATREEIMKMALHNKFEWIRGLGEKKTSDEYKRDMNTLLAKLLRKGQMEEMMGLDELTAQFADECVLGSPKTPENDTAINKMFGYEGAEDEKLSPLPQSLSPPPEPPSHKKKWEQLGVDVSTENKYNPPPPITETEFEKLLTSIEETTVNDPKAALELIKGCDESEKCSTPSLQSTIESIMALECSMPLKHFYKVDTDAKKYVDSLTDDVKETMHTKWFDKHNNHCTAAENAWLCDYGNTQMKEVDKLLESMSSEECHDYWCNTTATQRKMSSYMCDESGKMKAKYWPPNLPQAGESARSVEMFETPGDSRHENEELENEYILNLLDPDINPDKLPTYDMFLNLYNAGKLRVIAETGKYFAFLISSTTGEFVPLDASPTSPMGAIHFLISPKFSHWNLVDTKIAHLINEIEVYSLAKTAAEILADDEETPDGLKMRLAELNDGELWSKTTESRGVAYPGSRTSDIGLAKEYSKDIRLAVHLFPKGSVHGHTHIHCYSPKLTSLGFDAQLQQNRFQNSPLGKVLRLSESKNPDKHVYVPVD
jgi:hypothetical protein